MRYATKTTRRNPSSATEATKKEAVGVEALLGQALRARSSGRKEQALALLRRAVVSDMRRPEPWYWLGKIQEEDRAPLAAAYSYFMAHDIGRYEPASSALRRMGYLEGCSADHR